MISKNQIKQVKALHLKKFRDQEQLFIAEGVKIVSEIIQFKPESISEIFVTESYFNQNKTAFPKSLQITTVSGQELERISLLSSPNHILAVCNYFQATEPAIDLSKKFSLYLDDIRDPGNLGTILRIADWFGINEIFASEKSTEIYNSKTIQSAMGAFLRVKVHYVNLDALLKNKNIAVYGAVLNGKNIYKQELGCGLIVIGSEASGISVMNLKKITHPITIPAATSNNTESLNAAMATSIICAEFFRQISKF